MKKGDCVSIQTLRDRNAFYERRGYARGLRAAARAARRDAEGWKAHAERDEKRGWKESRLRCLKRSYALYSLARWCDRRARAVERGK